MADDGIGQQHVGGLGAEHHFGFRDFRHGQAGGAGSELQFTDAHAFVRLGVGPQAEPVLRGVIGLRGADCAP